jgi:hypothetical protein
MDIVAWNISNSSYNKLKQLLFFLDPRLASILKMPETSMVRWTSMYQWVSFQLHCCTIETVVCSCGEHHDVLHLSSEMLGVHIMHVTIFYLFNNFFIHWPWLVLKLWHWIGRLTWQRLELNKPWYISYHRHWYVWREAQFIHHPVVLPTWTVWYSIYPSFIFLRMCFVDGYILWNYDIDITVCIHCSQGVEEAVERRGAVT